MNRVNINARNRRQLSHFLARKRDEDPELSRSKILTSAFLLNHYREIISLCINLGQTGKSNSNFELAAKHYTQIKIAEIGSAGGVTSVMFPKVITTDMRECTGVSIVTSASNLPFDDNSLELIIAKDTLHHIPDVQRHFSEISRILKVGGRAVYAEPNWNSISKFVFKHLHPEPWDENVSEWNFHSLDPMFSNQALPMIIFKRDISKFYDLFPNLQIEVISKPLAGLSFLLSGGVYKRSILPDTLLGLIRKIENKSTTWMKIFGFVRIIVLTKHS